MTRPLSLANSSHGMAALSTNNHRPLLWFRGTAEGSYSDNLPAELDVLFVLNQHQLGQHQLAVPERQDAKARPPVPGVVLKVIGKRLGIDVGQTASIEAVPCAVVIGPRRHLGGMQMPGNDVLARTDRIIVGGMEPALIAMLDDRIVVDPNRPTSLPGSKMVAKMNAGDLGELG